MLGNTQPDILAVVNILSQVTGKTFSAADISAINTIHPRATANRNIGLNYGALNASTLHVVAFSDAYFACNMEGFSQLGFVILIADGTGRAEIVHYTSRKAKRVVCSVLGTGIFAFADPVDVAIRLRHDLKAIKRQDLPLRVLKDISSLFTVVVKSTTPTETRIMIYLRPAREAFERRDITEIGWIK